MADDIITVNLLLTPGDTVQEVKARSGCKLLDVLNYAVRQDGCPKLLRDNRGSASKPFDTLVFNIGRDTPALTYVLTKNVEIRVSKNSGGAAPKAPKPAAEKVEKKAEKKVAKEVTKKATKKTAAK